ncbi:MULTISPECIES: hypothetical protein [unclassified Nocardioides]|uniref:hypothetical protein n=1 Tax=unclassified Nocardioides TaxID=2615069 RepID=UPI001054FD94|nr:MULTISPECIES: hypothetical protein [unclassified Nocardioides]
MALLVSLTTPVVWLHQPAVPEANLPTMNLDFADLHDFSSMPGSPGLQEAYFSWLAWLLVVATIVVAIAWSLTFGRSGRAVAGLLAVLAAAGLIVTTLAIKGDMSWSWLGDQLKNIRIGGYLLLVSYAVLLVFAFVARDRAQVPSKE